MYVYTCIAIKINTAINTMEAFQTFVGDIDSIALTLLCGPIVAVTICGLLLIAKSKDKRKSLTQRGNKAPIGTTAIRENLNYSCSNEELSLSYLERKSETNKKIALKQKRKQKGKQNLKNLENVPTMRSNVIKGNIKHSKEKQTNILRLRKQYITAAVIDENEISRNIPHCNRALKFNLPVSSSLPSYSSPSNSSMPSLGYSSAGSRHRKEIPAKSHLRQFVKLNMNEHQLVEQIRRYVIDPNLLRIYGFPVESIYYERCVEIYKCLPKHLAEEAVTQDNQRHHRHFYGRKKYDIINMQDGLHSKSYGQKRYIRGSTDSGQGSVESSPRFTDSDSSEMGEEDYSSPILAFYTPDGVYQIFSEYCNSIEKQCVRCSKMFKVNEIGEYLSFDSCSYHWGKLRYIYDGKCYNNLYSCCQRVEFSEGCSKHPLHVWNGVAVGINGPYSGFLHTQPKKINQRHPKLYAIDCEMSYTGLGLEVTKVTVVGFNGYLVYEHFVKPQAPIIDYNTRFSGVSQKDFLPNSAKSFEDVQKDLLNLFDSETILIGHGLDNDLKALRLVHKTIVDTSVIFNHSTGYPYRRSLKNLTKSFLKRDIQCGDLGHSSFEDSRACLELMMWKIRKDLRHWN